MCQERVIFVHTRNRAPGKFEDSARPTITLPKH